jgi:hypothetical protein
MALMSVRFVELVRFLTAVTTTAAGAVPGCVNDGFAADDRRPVETSKVIAIYVSVNQDTPTLYVPVVPVIPNVNAFAASVANNQAGGDTAKFAPVMPLENDCITIGHSRLAFEENHPT